MSVEIIIDREKCNYSIYDPKGCKKCLQICGACVFATRPAKPRDFSIPKEQRLHPTVWELLVTWEDHCTTCGSCLKVCPQKAIKIIVDGKELLV